MKIAIYGQNSSKLKLEFIDELIAILVQKKIDFYFETEFLQVLVSNQLISKKLQNQQTFSKLDKSFNMLFSIGGDGSFLRAATIVGNTNVPILGINTGRLGFLASVQPENLEKCIDQILNKEYKISKRTLLGLNCKPKIDAIKELNFAMNEITVNRKDTTSMITIDTYLNGEFLTSYWADGLIISTPTGSTGYSLSCGGPILTPDAGSLVLTPIAPHNLNARPFVIPDNTTITLKVSGRDENYLVSLDSRIAFVKNESELTIKKTSFKINMVEIPEITFLKTLRNKLLFGIDNRN